MILLFIIFFNVKKDSNEEYYFDIFVFLWFNSSWIGNFRPWATRYKKSAAWTNCDSFRSSWRRLWNYFWSRKMFYSHSTSVPKSIGPLYVEWISDWSIFGKYLVVKLLKDSQKRIMALINEVNEFHKTRRRGLRRRKRNHYYNQTYKKIDEGKGF